MAAVVVAFVALAAALPLSLLPFLLFPLLVLLLFSPARPMPKKL